MSDHDQTVLTFTKKDIIVLENDVEKENKENKLGEENLPTFENRCSIISSECILPQPYS